jgi:hypothetical protein
MKFATVSKSLLLGMVLVLASHAFAANKASLQLNSTVLVNGTQLKPGDYKVQWEGSGPNVEVSILQGKTVVAKVPAHVAELQSAPAHDATVTTQNASGPNSLIALRFGGKKFSLELGAAGDASQSAGSSQ